MKILLVMILFLCSTIAGAQNAGGGDSFVPIGGSVSAGSGQVDSATLKKYPKIDEYLNSGQIAEEGKCPSQCQASQMECYNKAGPEERDNCTTSFNSCMGNCGGEIGDNMDPAAMSDPSNILEGLNLDPKLIESAINAHEGGGQQQGQQGGQQGFQPTSTSSPIPAAGGEEFIR